jgi:hypothetical protein
MNLIINTATDPTKSLMRSAEDLRTARIPSFVLGDRFNISLDFVDGLNKPFWFGHAGTIIQIALGLPTSGDLFSQQTLQFSDNAYRENFNLNTTELVAYLGSSSSRSLYFEVNVQTYPSFAKTLLQTRTTIANQLLS